MKTLTIGQTAEEAGVHIETLRYYERRRLIPKPARSPSGYRQYPPDVVKRIRFIKRAQMLGFTLDEIAELLDLRVDPETNCDDVQQCARDKITDIEHKIAELTRMKQALDRLVHTCEQRDLTTEECPILEALEHGE